MPDGRRVDFAWVGMSMPCPVPVTTDGQILGEDGQPLPMEVRTRTCDQPAHWWIGAQLSCDEHTKLACGFMGVDFDDLCAEAVSRPATPAQTREGGS